MMKSVKMWDTYDMINYIKDIKYFVKFSLTPPDMHGKSMSITNQSFIHQITW